MIAATVAKKAAAVAAIVTAVVLCVTALGHATWLLLLDYLTPVGAALALAAVMAVIAGAVAWFSFGKPIRFSREPEPEPETLTQKVIGLAKDRPIVATVAGLAAGFIFLRNPALATIVAAALSGASDTGPKRKH